MTSDGLGAPRPATAAISEGLREALVKWREEVARLSVDPEINELGHAAMEAVRDKIDEIIALRASPAPSEGLREIMASMLAQYTAMGAIQTNTLNAARAALRGEGETK